MSPIDNRDPSAIFEVDQSFFVSDESFPDDAWDTLNHLLTDSRRERMKAVVAGRTARIQLVVQDVHDPHNVSACLRSAEAFGVQHCHVVTLRHRFRASTVSRGVAPWLSLHRHASVDACAVALKAAGYKLCAGVPLPSAVPLHELPAQEKLAVVFGNEHAGIDASWRPHIDYLFTIPMVGMVESLNISVGAAITLQHLTHRSKQELQPDRYALSPEEQKRLLNHWICRQLHEWPKLLSRLRAPS